MRKLRTVVIGGGTGAPVSIRTLLDMGCDVDAVVAMADDGGSTGILRERAGAIPPGDVRKCLVAMAADREAPLVKAFQYRFDYAQNHALGNLVLTALNDTGSTFPEAIAICEDLLGARGHVYPSTLDKVTMGGYSRDGRYRDSQVAVSHSDCALDRVFLRPDDPEAYGPAMESILEADLIVLGPGSLFTSIIPNLLVPGIMNAIRISSAPTVFVCGIADMQGETWGLNCAEHVEALLDHGMRDRLDIVLLHDGGRCAPQKIGSATASFERISGETIDEYDKIREPRRVTGVRTLQATSDLIVRIQRQGPRVITHDFVDPKRPTWHDPVYLRNAFMEVCERCRLPLK